MCCSCKKGSEVLQPAPLELVFFNFIFLNNEPKSIVFPSFPPQVRPDRPHQGDDAPGRDQLSELQGGEGGEAGSVHHDHCGRGEALRGEERGGGGLRGSHVTGPGH